MWPQQGLATQRQWEEREAPLPWSKSINEERSTEQCPTDKHSNTIPSRTDGRTEGQISGLAAAEAVP